ncbi:DUF6059 family protein [Kitasatospora viridis]|uniref:Uncharacterized protein n=1 Tax=Kitasatospora viridis TaxID=281105 RepID=A0A561UCI4_9ACTN|nr:DUF6059 family protein [Kitasatospora viridis]TWF97073.1 hypothetical protein FHX73_11848 [Kitasatospora viridis]
MGLVLSLLRRCALAVARSLTAFGNIQFHLGEGYPPNTYQPPPLPSEPPFQLVPLSGPPLGHPENGYRPPPTETERRLWAQLGVDLDDVER